MARSLSRGTGWVVAQMVVLSLQVVLPVVLNLPLFGWPVVAGGALLLLALGLAAWSMLTLGSSLTPVPQPRDDSRLVVSGPYRLVRHPIYSALLLVSFGWSLLWFSGVLTGLSILLVVVFAFKTRLEERWLVQRYPEYDAYRRRTGRLVPRLFRRGER